MKTFDVEFNFSMRCSTRGYSIKAESAEDALAKCQACIDEHGYLNDDKFRAAGGTLENGGSWDVHNGTDHAYDIDEDEIEETDED